MSNAPDLMTAAEVAARLRVTRSTVSRWAKDGVLPIVRIGGVLRFRRVDVDALLAPATEGDVA